MESEVEETNEQATEVQEFESEQQTAQMSEGEEVKSKISPGSSEVREEERLKTELNYLEELIEEIEEHFLTLKAQIKRMYEMKVNV